MAHHDLAQLKSQEPALASAVLTHPSTRICFRVNEDDARKLAEGFTHFMATDLLNLGIGQAICRVERADFDFNLDVPMPPPVTAQVQREKREAIVAHSRATYGMPRADVEQEIASAMPTNPSRHESASEASKRPAAETLTEMEMRYLNAVTAEPGKRSSAYAKLARISGQRAVEIRTRLAAAGLLREHSVATGHRGRSAIILEPLQKALKLIAENPPNI